MSWYSHRVELTVYTTHLLALVMMVWTIIHFSSVGPGKRFERNQSLPGCFSSILWTTALLNSDCLPPNLVITHDHKGVVWTSALFWRLSTSEDTPPEVNCQPTTHPKEALTLIKISDFWWLWCAILATQVFRHRQARRVDTSSRFFRVPGQTLRGLFVCLSF